MALNLKALSTLINKLKESTETAIDNPSSQQISLKDASGVGDVTKRTWSHTKKAGGGGGGGEGLEPSLQVDENPNKALPSVVNWLVEVCTLLVDKVNHLSMKKEGEKVNEEKHKKEVEEKCEKLASESDEIRQRSMRGNLIVSSPNFNGKVSMFKQKTYTLEGREQKESELEMVLRVIKQKTCVEFKKEEVHAFHPIGQERKNPTSFILKVNNRAPHSNYSILSAGMKTGRNDIAGENFTQENVFISHQITPKRVAFLERGEAQEGGGGEVREAGQ